jgi:hypothetical protein
MLLPERISSTEMVSRFTWPLLILLVAVQAMAGVCSLHCGMSLARDTSGTAAAHSMAHCHAMAAEQISRQSANRVLSSRMHLQSPQTCSGLPCHPAMAVASTADRVRIGITPRPDLWSSREFPPFLLSSSARTCPPLRIAHNSVCDPLLSVLRV